MTARRARPSQYDMAVPTRTADGSFASFEHWVSNATRLIGGENALCVDAAGRICARGGDFMRARDEGKFPVHFFFDAGNQTERERRHQSLVADRMLHPYRPASMRVGW